MLSAVGQSVSYAIPGRDAIQSGYAVANKLKIVVANLDQDGAEK